MFVQPAFVRSVSARVHSRALTGLLSAAAVLIALSILVRPINHDEGQYVAAIALMRGGLPYRDFAYLQTPLQPLLLSPLALLPAGWLLLGARCVNGLFALATLKTIAFALRGRAGGRHITIALAALLCTESFLFSASVARNDALPMLLLAGAITALLRAIDRPRGTMLLGGAGLLLGLATAAKISFAVPAAGAALFLLVRAREFGGRAILLFAAGAIAGVLPIIVLGALAPAAFRFDVFTYSLNAPAQWWTAIGDRGMLAPAHRIGELLKLALLGPVLVAIAAAAIDRRRTPDRLLLDLMILGGLIGAYMPEPAFAQYLVPLLPPLFARFALALDGSPSRRGWLLGLTAAAAIAGLAWTAIYGVRAAARGPELSAAVKQGRAVARLAAGGPIVTLAPERAAGADTNVDPGFVTGPFLYRINGALARQALRDGFSPNWQAIGPALAARPPAVILVGAEPKARPPLHPRGLEAPLAAWAMTHRYTPVALGDGFVALVRPR